MRLAEAGLNWQFGSFAEGMEAYGEAINRDPRLLDDQYLRMVLHWPPILLSMVSRVAVYVLSCRHFWQFLN